MLLEEYLLIISVSCYQLQLNVLSFKSLIFLCCREMEQLFHSYASQYQTTQGRDERRSRGLGASQLLTFFWTSMTACRALHSWSYWLILFQIKVVSACFLYLAISHFFVLGAGFLFGLKYEFIIFVIRLKNRVIIFFFSPLSLEYPMKWRFPDCQ